MAKKLETFTIKIDLEGLKDITGLGNALKKLEKSSKPTMKSFRALAGSIRDVTKFTPKTISQFKQKDRILRKLREETNVSSRAFKRLGTAIDANKKKLQSFNTTAKKGFSFKGLGVGGKAAAGAALGSTASRFLPAGAATGASIGALTGGPAGAVAGAAIGGTVDAVAGGVNFAREAAIYASEIQKLQIALKGVTKDQATFEYGLGVIAQTSKNLNVPIAASTRQFTTLSASVLGAGGTIQDAELVFTGVSNAIKATGGNAEDVQSAIRAMSQIFGKGKVSAEELQGQLGERLAGAVVKFAEANGSSLAKLQKDLRDGTVGLDQVIKFAEKLNVDFAETAKTVANSSADAGQRLAKQMDDMKLAVGTAVLPIGAAFQQAFGDIVTGITNSKGAMDALTTTFKVIGAAAFATFAAVRFLTRSLVDMAKILYHVANLDFQAAFNVMKQGFKDTADTAKKDFEALANIDIFGTKAEKDKNKPKKVSYPVYVGGKPVNQPSGLATLTDGGEGDKDFDKNLQKNIDFIQKARDAEKKAEDEKYTRFLDFQLLSGQITQQKFDQIQIDREALKISEDLGINLEYVKEVLTQAADKSFNFAEEFAKISEKATDLKSRVGELALDVTDRLGNAFADFFTTGKMGFADLARSAIQELNRIIIKAAFMKFVANPILGALGLTKSAYGNVISKGKVLPSAKGNVFAQNKIVPYAYGGIVSKPTLFPMANGAGLMGEAGPEAIMPLKRGRNGKLGVQASGGVGNIVVNVDASGSSVEGNEQQGKDLGRAISAAIQSELLKQKRPGGLLR